MRGSCMPGTTQLPPTKSCPVCSVAMQSEPVDPLFEYDVFVCRNCSTKVLIHHSTPEDDDED